MPAPTHILFVDDSGNKEYSEDHKYSIKGGRTPYFVFCGLLFSNQAARDAAAALESAKRDLFRSPDVEIKANWLRMPAEREKRYLTPLRLTNDQLDAAVEAIYTLFASLDVTVMACVVNKQEAQQRYERPHYTPAIAYDLLLQRVQQCAQAIDAHVRVTIDAMSGATPHGRQYQANLRQQHERLKQFGSPYRRVTFDRIADISFRDSKHDHRLQLADLAAYAVYRQFVEYGDAWETKTSTLPVYPYLRRLAQKFRHDGAGRIQGYGIAKFPLNQRVPWSLKKKSP